MCDVLEVTLRSVLDRACQLLVHGHPKFRKHRERNTIGSIGVWGSPLLLVNVGDNIWNKGLKLVIKGGD